MTDSEEVGEGGVVANVLPIVEVESKIYSKNTLHCLNFHLSK